MENFDPNSVGVENGNYFGLPFTVEQSELVLISAPWDVTASYGGGAHSGPDAIIGASTQLDLYDEHATGVWSRGIATVPINYSIQDSSTVLREDARKVIKHLERGGEVDDESLKRKLERINRASGELNEMMYCESKQYLSQGKIVGLVGGDHSTPLGHIRAVAEHHESVGVLHIDAHYDLRPAYQGFEYSHASIMYNVIEQIPQVCRLVQVGIRDFCDQEVEFAQSNPRIESWRDKRLADNAFLGMTWDKQCDLIIDSLPAKVYVSFDIDGLSPENCPNTGTPVPGGLSFNQAVYLLAKVVDSGRRIVGFDLCEVAPGRVEIINESAWDGNVGARILYKLCNLALKK